MRIPDYFLRLPKVGLMAPQNGPVLPFFLAGIVRTCLEPPRWRHSSWTPSKSGSSMEAPWWRSKLPLWHEDTWGKQVNCAISWNWCLISMFDHVVFNGWCSLSQELVCYPKLLSSLFWGWAGGIQQIQQFLHSSSLSIQTNVSVYILHIYIYIYSICVNK